MLLGRGIQRTLTAYGRKASSHATSGKHLQKDRKPYTKRGNQCLAGNFSE